MLPPCLLALISSVAFFSADGFLFDVADFLHRNNAGAGATAACNPLSWCKSPIFSTGKEKEEERGEDRRKMRGEEVKGKRGGGGKGIERKGT